MRKDLETRFKLLALLACSLDMWDEQMIALGMAMDEQHPDCEAAISYYEQAILDAVETPDDEGNIDIFDFPPLCLN